MKYKKIMLITLLLLAVLTIGAVSASDDAALDNVTASDDVDIIAEEGDGQGDGPDDDEYGAKYSDEEIITDETNDNYDSNAFIASMTVPNTTASGAFVISTDAEDDTEDDVILFSASIIGELPSKWTINESTQDLVCNVYLKDLTNLTALIDGNSIYFNFIDDEGDPVDEYCDESTLKVTESYFQFIDDEYEDVVVNITVAEGFNFYIPADEDEAFARVSVPDGLKGFIAIYVEDEDDLIYYFYQNIADMKGESDENGTVYGITLKMLNGYENFVEEDVFTISFIDEDDEDNEIASADYEIFYDEDEKVVQFNEIEEIAGEGEDLTKSADIFIADEANAANDEAIIRISVSAVYEKIKDNFTVYILGDDERNVTLNITNLFDNGVFVISVSDLFDDNDLKDIEVESDYSFLVQFYDNLGKGNYYIETEDVTIYINPYIYDEVNAYNDDWVISFTEIEDADDEFKVTISQDGHEDIVKTFKVSELENMAEDDDEDPYYVLKCSDLNLTVPGEYGITVNFTEDGEELIYNIGLVDVRNELDIRAPEEGSTFENIEDQIFIIQVDEDFDGYVKVFVNGTQVGEDIPLADLGWSMGPLGREIVLNDFNITESGNYTLKVEVYDENDTFINNATADVEVTVGENSVEFNDAYYTQDTYMIFDLRTPVDGIFLISLNGIEAGYYDPADHDIYWYDDFVDVWLDNENARFLKVGDYEVNVTLRHSSAVRTPFATGSFSILSMNATADKETYLEGENVTITFDAGYYPDNFAKVEVFLVKSWSPMGPDDELIAVFDDEDLAVMYDGKGSFSFDLKNIPAGENMIIIHYMVADTLIDLHNDNYTLFASDAVGVTVLEIIDPNLTISVDDIFEGDPAVVKITTVENFTGKVIVTIGTVNFNATVINGTGTLSIPDLPADTYLVTAVLNAQGQYAADLATDMFKVGVNPNLTIAVANIQEGNPAVVTVTTNATFSGNVTVTIANKNYTVSVANGKGTINVAGLAAGTYNATAIFAATGIFGYSEKTTSFTVTKKPVTPAKKKDKIKLTLKKVKVKKSAKKLVLRATLKINGKAAKGKKIIFKFKGKKYKAKTNKKGVAKVTIKKKVLKKLKVGKKVKYQATYGKVTKKYTVKVKK